MNQTSRYTIDSIKPEFHDAILEIHEKILKNFTKPQWKSPVRGRLNQENVVGFVALVENEVVGFIIGAISHGDFGQDKSGWIEVIGVDPKFMGHGIGKALAERLFDQYRSVGVHDVYTSVRWDSGDMLSFFKSLGFDRSDFLNLRRKIDLNAA